MIYIGIDPGQITGFAAWSPSERKLLQVASFGRVQPTKKQPAYPGFFEAQEAVKKVLITSPVTLYIENANLNTHQFSGSLKGANTLRAKLRAAQGVGKVMKEGQLWVEWAKRNEIPFFQFKPGTTPTKYSAALFQKVTGWSQKTNEHSRDAAMMVFGR